MQEPTQTSFVNASLPHIVPGIDKLLPFPTAGKKHRNFLPVGFILLAEAFHHPLFFFPRESEIGPDDDGKEYQRWNRRPVNQLSENGKEDPGILRVAHDSIQALQGQSIFMRGFVNFPPSLRSLGSDSIDLFIPYPHS